MNTLDDLRRLLEADAGAAPGTDGVVAAAERGAARIRRRRRLTAVAGAAALVAAVAMVVPVVADRRHADRQPSVGVPAERLPGQVTLGVDPASGYVPLHQDIDTNGQWIIFAPAGPDETQGQAGAIALDPDAGFDPSRLRQGERTTVAGHEAWYVGDYPFGDYGIGYKKSPMHRTPTVAPLLGWRDPGGAWVLVYQSPVRPSREELHQAAQAIRVTPAREMTLPISLGPLPDGMPLNRVSSNHRFSGALSLGGPPVPLDAKILPGLGTGAAVTIGVAPGDRLQIPPTGVTRVAPVAGHDAWYAPTNPYDAQAKGTLYVRAGHCTFAFTSRDADRASAARLREIAEGATYADCADPATWGPVVRR
jgi:hypothetical protein